MSQSDFEALRKFLEERPAAVKASKPLKNGTIIEMNIVGDENPYHVVRENKQTFLRTGPCPEEPKLRFTISPKAIQRLLDFGSDDIGEYGVEFFKIMVSEDPDYTLGVKLNTGFIGLTRMGVFGILAMGGKAVLSFLARHGLKGPGEIKKAISKLRGKSD